MDIQLARKTGDSFADIFDMSCDDQDQLLDADHVTLERLQLDHSLHERQIRGRIMTALNRSRQLAARAIWAE